MTDQQLLDAAIVFAAGMNPGMNGIIPIQAVIDVIKVREHHVLSDVTIEKRANGWAICYGPDCLCLNKDSHTYIWEYESLPSSRSDDFVKRSRFKSVRVAFDVWINYFDDAVKKCLQNKDYVRITNDYLARNGSDYRIYQ